MPSAQITLIGGPTALVELDGFRRLTGPFHLTMDTNDVVETAHQFGDALIVPVHHDGWAHFSESGEDLEKTFDALGIGARLKLLKPGLPAIIEF